ncbi:MAG: hypothetical protein IJP07_06095 [Firmicutes bacterium]|nr:hypothetical protein [Bacillota bacterium]
MKKRFILYLALVCFFVLSGCRNSLSDPPAVQEVPPALQEAENLAEDDSETEATAEETEKLNALLESLADGDPALMGTLFLDDGAQIGPFGKEFSVRMVRALAHPTWEIVKNMEAPSDSAVLRLCTEDENWALHVYEEANLLMMVQEEESFLFTTELSPAEWETNIWNRVRNWFDECEFTALGGGWTEIQDGKSVNKSYVIPDTGQSFLEAAQEAVQAVDNIHLQASSGSKECYTYIRSLVSFAEAATTGFRKNGRIGDNTYCILIERILVPENDRAAFWAVAGEYTGDDPDVPERALCNQLCGYVSQEADGWHVQVVGTGW